MRNGVLCVAALAGLATSASAQLLGHSVSFQGPGTGGVDNNEYRWDNGTSEDSIGFGAGTAADIVWMSTFTVTGGNTLISGINTCFGTGAFAGSSGVVAGQSFRVFVWSGSPTGVNTLLGSAIGTVNAGSIDTNVLQTVNFSSAVTVSGNFFIGAAATTTAGGYQAPGDENSVPQYVAGRSFLAGTIGGLIDPTNLAGSDTGVIEYNAVVPAGGYWMLSANATPAPSSLGLLALGGLLAARRRR